VNEAYDGVQSEGRKQSNMKSSLGPGAILIIEDNKNIASLVAKYLTKEGFAFIGAPMGHRFNMRSQADKRSWLITMGIEPRMPTMTMIIW